MWAKGVRLTMLYLPSLCGVASFPSTLRERCSFGENPRMTERQDYKLLRVSELKYTAALTSTLSRSVLSHEPAAAGGGVKPLLLMHRLVCVRSARRGEDCVVRLGARPIILREQPFFKPFNLLRVCKGFDQLAPLQVVETGDTFYSQPLITGNTFCRLESETGHVPLCPPKTVCLVAHL
ncbi:hypothetical protein EYF80_008954 [Liparis tanakae]|uniref:Uncharacterized protein n=1 Tax=Liparis tanakae TaxID=230148 RepID=A0A4Z2IRS5_9TELE|nr:hypothetical protein EYF80_008954 [Liparis tanakae]